MGASGAAYYGQSPTPHGRMSTVLTQDELEHFEQKVSTVMQLRNHCS